LADSTLPTIVANGEAEATLVGILIWDDRELVWASEWRIVWLGKLHRWNFRAITFDDAFRRGIGGAAQILSDNGEPEP
jgi:hypothetical protein